MAVTPTQTTGLTWADLESFPDDGNRYEVIDGVLYVTGAPTTRHQRVVRETAVALTLYSREVGGQVYWAPVGLVFAADTGVQPDILYVGPDRLAIQGEKVLDGAPTLVVEVSSSSTRRRDLGVKLALYAREGVPEYWFADLRSDELVVHAGLADGDYREVRRLTAGDTLASSQLPGFSAPVAALLVR